MGFFALLSFEKKEAKKTLFLSSFFEKKEAKKPHFLPSFFE